MRRLILIVALAALALPAVANGAAPETEAECLAAGGRWARGGLLPMETCFLPTPDAGKACAKAGDCTGYCLSETRTCSTETPKFGCFGFLDEAGVELTICVD